MRACILALVAGAALAAAPVHAHGPQIQVTNHNNKIVTRRLIQDGPYSNTLTATTSVYVMPLVDIGGVWYTLPNQDLDPMTQLPQYFSGPGLAYGYDQADGGAQAFAAGSVISVSFIEELKLWNGTAFADAGATDIKGFRGSNVNISGPATSIALASNGPSDLVSLDVVLPDYGPEGAEIHNTIRFALLGDGASPASASPNGVYLAKLQISSTQNGLVPSEPFYFVLHKNATTAEIAMAVSKLGIDAAFVQYVPEPASLILVSLTALIATALHRRR